MTNPSILSVVVMYCDDDAQYLENCLASTPRSHDAEVIVMKTVPVPVSPAALRGEPVMLRQAGNVKFYEWEYVEGRFDFAAARNVAASVATGEWIFSLDCDERMMTEQHYHIIEGCRTASGDIGGVKVAMISFERSHVRDGMSVTMSCPVRLFRRKPEIRYEGNIHESVIESIVRAGYRVEPGEIIVWHRGYQDLTPEAIVKKARRNIEVSARELAGLGAFASGERRERLIDIIADMGMLLGRHTDKTIPEKATTHIEPAAPSCAYNGIFNY
jgi:hypothetical protein